MQILGILILYSVFLHAILAMLAHNLVIEPGTGPSLVFWYGFSKCLHVIVGRCWSVGVFCCFWDGWRCKELCQLCPQRHSNDSSQWSATNGRWMAALKASLWTETPNTLHIADANFLDAGQLLQFLRCIKCFQLSHDLWHAIGWVAKGPSKVTKTDC